MSLGLAIAADARADDIPIVTLGDVGPDQEIPTDRAFYVAGEIAGSVEHAQAIVVRRGSPSLFGGDGPACRDLLAELHVDVATTSAADDEDDGETFAAARPRYDAGVHRAFELFPHAEGASRRALVLVTTPWRRLGAEARRFQVLVPHDRAFFSAGYGYCLFVVTTEQAQEIADDELRELVDGVASKLVACGDKASCDEDALAEYETRVLHALARTREVASRPPGVATAVAAQLKEAARVELGTTTGIVEAIARIGDRWHDTTNVMTPAPTAVWADTSTDPFAQAVVTLLARSGALLPQVRADKAGTTVALFTTDGKLQVKAIQLLDDGRSIRVASSTAPKGDQARVLTATTDTLAIADGVVLYDLVQLGHRRVRVDKEWMTLAALGERIAGLGQDTWTGDDDAFLAAATAHMKRLADFVDLTTTGVACAPRKYAATETELSNDAIRRTLGEWLACQKTDAAALESMREQLAQLASEDQAWESTKDRLVARSRRILTLTTTAPTELRVAFASPTWVFSYVTPIVGYAGVLRPDDTFGLFYLGAQLHLDPNPVGDVIWRDGVTTRDLRRALALELGVAPYGGSFGPDMRYAGPGSLPPIFIGAAVHVLPYTSLSFGGTIIDRRNSTLREEEPNTVVTPYFGLTIQLNAPDLIRRAAGPTSDTAVIR